MMMMLNEQFAKKSENCSGFFLRQTQFSSFGLSVRRDQNPKIFTVLKTLRNILNLLFKQDGIQLPVFIAARLEDNPNSCDRRSYL